MLQMTQKQNLEAELRNQLLRLLLFGGKSPEGDDHKAVRHAGPAAGISGPDHFAV